MFSSVTANPFLETMSNFFRKKLFLFVACMARNLSFSRNFKMCEICFSKITALEGTVRSSWIGFVKFSNFFDIMYKGVANETYEFKSEKHM